MAGLHAWRSPLAGLKLPCGTCGWHFTVSPHGRIPAHRQWRISQWGQPYRHDSQCDGGTQPPDTSNLSEEMVSDG